MNKYLIPLLLLLSGCGHSHKSSQFFCVTAFGPLKFDMKSQDLSVIEGSLMIKEDGRRSFIPLESCVEVIEK